jgi:hypothetical protein
MKRVIEIQFVARCERAQQRGDGDDGDEVGREERNGRLARRTMADVGMNSPGQRASGSRQGTLLDGVVVCEWRVEVWRWWQFSSVAAGKHRTPAASDSAAKRCAGARASKRAGRDGGCAQSYGPTVHQHTQARYTFA